MNSWAVLTIMVFMNLMISAIISSTEGIYDHDYIYTKLEGFNDKQNEYEASLADTKPASKEFDIKSTVGDELQLSGSWLSVFKYSGVTMPQATNSYEWIFIQVYGIFKILISLYLGFLLMMIIINKRNT